MLFIRQFPLVRLLFQLLGVKVSSESREQPTRFLLARTRIVLGCLLGLGAFATLWAWAAPSPPGAPTFSGTTATSVIVKAPVLPSGATSLSLQRKITTQLDTTYTTLASNQAGSSSYTSSGLTPSTGYTFRYLGVATSGSTPGTAAPMTTGATPAAPTAPTFTNVKATTLSVTAPALPSGAQSLTLQNRLSTEADTAYVIVATGIGASAVTNVSSLSPSTAYVFRYQGVSGAVSTSGTSAPVTTLALPGMAAAPTFSSLHATSVVVGAPALPANSTSLSLQSRLSSQADTFYSLLGQYPAACGASMLLC